MRSAGSRGLPRSQSRDLHHTEFHPRPGSREGPGRGVPTFRRAVDADDPVPRSERYRAVSLRGVPARARFPGTAAARSGPRGQGRRRLVPGRAPLSRAGGRPGSRRGGARGALLGGRLEVQGDRRPSRSGRDRPGLQDPLRGQHLGEEGFGLGGVSAGPEQGYKGPKGPKGPQGQGRETGLPLVSWTPYKALILGTEVSNGKHETQLYTRVQSSGGADGKRGGPADLGGGSGLGAGPEADPSLA